MNFFFDFKSRCEKRKQKQNPWFSLREHFMLYEIAIQTILTLNFELFLFDGTKKNRNCLDKLSKRDGNK